MPAGPLIDETHDPSLRSWVQAANDPACDYPIQNLPLCRFLRHDGDEPSLGTVIGDQILDLESAWGEGLFRSPECAAAMIAYSAIAREMHEDEPIRVYASLSVAHRRALRLDASRMLREDSPVAGDAAVRRSVMVPLASARLLPPVETVPNYTDFYASRDHARTVGSMFRPDNPLLPNYLHVPIGYHGRASSIVGSGTPIRRPMGQTKADTADAPAFGPCKLLDYEAELGLWIGRGNPLGEPVTMGDVREHMLGVCLLNDWSARDIQKWEYQPLGPFLAKNFATSVSPLVVTMEALEPFRVPGPHREPGDPEPLPYLRGEEPWALDITIEAWLSSSAMREQRLPPVLIGRHNARTLYWTFAQMLVHHTSNGCNLEAGDLLGSGTISGPGPDQRGCLLERTWAGFRPDGKPADRIPVELPTGEKRTFLGDGDELTLKGYCQGPGRRRIGLGECQGRILPAVER